MLISVPTYLCLTFYHQGEWCRLQPRLTINFLSIFNIILTQFKALSLNEEPRVTVHIKLPYSYSIRYSTEYSSRKNIDSHSPTAGCRVTVAARGDA